MIEMNDSLLIVTFVFFFQKTQLQYVMCTLVFTKGTIDFVSCYCQTGAVYILNYGHSQVIKIYYLQYTGNSIKHTSLILFYRVQLVQCLFWNTYYLH